MDTATGVYKGLLFPNGFASDDPPLTEIQKAMLDVTPDCIKLLSFDGRLLNMNRAGCAAFGVPATSKFGMPWLPLLPESVRRAGAEAISQAAQGHTARFNGESQTTDGTVKYWDNLLTPIIDETGRVRVILCVSRDVTMKTQLELDLQNALKREQLLSQEVQHRIKNVFAVMSGLILISEREAASANAPETMTAILREKVTALARASDAAFPPPTLRNVETDTVDVGPIVQSVLMPYGDRCRMTGDHATIAYKNMTTVALFLHELATNSLKYGSLGASDGTVDIHWTTDADALHLTWKEFNGPGIAEPPKKQGFGSEMIERIAESVGGRIEKVWSKEGLVSNLYLPNSSPRLA